MQPSRGAQAEAYLTQAAEALRSAGDPRFLWYSDIPQRYGEKSILGPLQQAGDAGNRRLRALRSSVIFAALTVEAYANDFLDEVLCAADANAIDRLPTLEKLLLGPNLAGFAPPFVRGSEPLQTVKKLFEVRNGLVHARSSGYSPFIQYIKERDHDDFGPSACGRYIRRVAETVATLDNLCKPPHMVGISINLSSYPEVIDEVVSQIGDRIDSWVPQDAVPPLDLGEAAERRAMKKAAKENLHRATDH
jgi:hypothetical protein